MISQLILTADEDFLAGKYHLKEYFEGNDNFVLLVADIKKIIEKRFGKITDSFYAKNWFVSLTQDVLEQCRQLFEYVNGKHASQHTGMNIPTEEWKRICSVGSKIIVHMGWVLDSEWR